MKERGERRGRQWLAQILETERKEREKQEREGVSESANIQKLSRRGRLGEGGSEKKPGSIRSRAAASGLPVTTVQRLDEHAAAPLP